MKFQDIIDHYEGSFYLFDVSILRDRINTLKECMPDRIDLCFAVKANPFLAKECDSYVSRLEICSEGEYRICKKLGISPSKMVISGINKEESLIKELIKDDTFDGILTVESLLQYQQICEYSSLYKKNTHILLRLTNGSQFGINKEDILDIYSDIPEYINILGIQFFSGTQKHSIKKINREVKKIRDVISSIEDTYNVKVKECEYGTGFPVNYFVGENKDDTKFLKEAGECLRGLSEEYHVTIELGRSMVASCGQFYTKIVDIKRNEGVNYALTDGGMHQLVYDGQVMAMKTPIFSVYGKQGDTDTYTICGSLCSMNDLIVKQALLPELEIGDLLCFENTGAYAMTEGMALFLTRDLPWVYLRDINGDITLLRKRQETEIFNTPIYERK